MPNTINVKDAGGLPVTLDTQGTPITGQALESGGYGPMGWFSSLRKAITDRLPGALGSNGGVKVDIVGGSSAGTQYAEGTTQPTITGTAMLWEDTLNVVSPVSAAKPLPVSDAGGTLTVDGSVSLAAALPAGANAIGSVGVTSVVPGTAATNLGKAVDAVAGASDTGVSVLGVRTDSLTTITPAVGDYAPIRVNSQGAIHVTGGGGGTEYVEGTTQATITGSVTLWEDAANVVSPISNAKPLPVQQAQLTSANDSVTVGTALPAGNNNIGDVDVLSLVPGTGATALGKAVDAAAGATDTGVAMLGIRTDSLGAITPAVGDYAQMRVNSQGALHVTGAGGGTQYAEGTTQATITGTAMLWEDASNVVSPISNVKPLPVQQAQLTSANDTVTVVGNVGMLPLTTGGLATATDIDLDEASPANIKNSAGQVYGWYLFNNAVTTRYVKLYNKASAPVLASDTPLFTIPIPAGAAANVLGANGITFSLGIGWAATTGVAANDTGAPSANDVIGNLFYK